MALRRIVCLFLLGLCSALVAQGTEQRPYIDSVTIGRGDRGDLVVGFRVARAHQPRVKEALESGLPVRFTYQIKVVRRRKIGPDAALADRSFDRILKKDNLKNRFSITYEDGRVEPDIPDLTTALEALSAVRGVSLLPLDAMATDPPPFLKIRVRLQEFKLPFRLHYLLAFVSFWDVDTDWYVLELSPDLPAAR